MNPGSKPFELKYLNIRRFGCGPQNKNAGVHCVFNLGYMTEIMRDIDQYKECIQETDIPAVRNKKRRKTDTKYTDTKYFENYLLTNWDQVERDHTAGLYLYDENTGEQNTGEQNTGKLIPVLLFSPEKNHIMDLMFFAFFVEQNFCDNGLECEIVTVFCRDYQGPNANRREKSSCAPNFNIDIHKKKVDEILRSERIALEKGQKITN